MAEIAARAGVVASVIYDHFGSKRELAIELLELHGAALIERTITELEPAPPAELLRTSIDLFYRFMEADPFVWRFLFRDPPADPRDRRGAPPHPRSRHRGHHRARPGCSAPHEDLLGVPYERGDGDGGQGIAGAVQGLAEWWFENREVPREQVTEVAFRTALGRPPEGTAAADPTLTREPSRLAWNWVGGPAVVTSSRTDHSLAVGFAGLQL